MRSLEEETVPQEDLFKVRFGRSRFVRLIGGALLGSATALALRDAPAEAHHNAPPSPCYGFGRCHYCEGRRCTQYCDYPPGHTDGCPSGGQWWNTCTAGGLLYRCCDFHETFPNVPTHHCICVELWGTC